MRHEACFSVCLSFMINCFEQWRPGKEIHHLVLLTFLSNIIKCVRKNTLFRKNLKRQKKVFYSIDPERTDKLKSWHLNHFPISNKYFLSCQNVLAYYLSVSSLCCWRPHNNNNNTSYDDADFWRFTRGMHLHAVAFFVAISRMHFGALTTLFLDNRINFSHKLVMW